MGARIDVKASVIACGAFAVVVAGAWAVFSRPSGRRRRMSSMFVDEAIHRWKRGRRGRPEVVLLGDSITQWAFDVNTRGFAAQLANWYERRADVVNRGYSGYNTRWVLYLLDTIFPQSGDGVPDTPPAILVTVFLGSNDMTINGPYSQQGIPIHEYTTNLKRIVAHIRAAEPGARIVLITPPPVHEASWAEAQLKYLAPEAAATKPSANRTVRQAALYARGCRDMANELGLPVVDAFAAFGGGDPAAALPLLSDGLHLSSAGNDLIFTLLCDTIKRHYPGLLPESLKMHAPLSSTIDPNDPAKSLESA